MAAFFLNESIRVFLIIVCALISVSGLDPARPLIEKHASHSYRLTRDDADVVQIIHTNAGTLGQQSLTGSVDLCINGGSLQPFCKRGLRLSRFHISSFVPLEFQMHFHSLNFVFMHFIFRSEPM